MFDVKLYAVTKTGNIKTWRCLVNDLGHAGAELSIITQTKINGKEVIRREIITEGKNLNKSNETTPFKQALSEATSRVNKKKDQGYSLEMPSITTKVNTNSLNLPRPMLATPIDKVKNIQWPLYWQPKLDGHRCIVTKQNGKMIAYSRQGKLITSMDHILSYLEDIMNEGMFLDGELYVHGEILQNIGSLIKRKQAGSEYVKYHIYDMILNLPYGARFQKLRYILKYDGRDNPPAFIVPTIRIPNMQKAQELTDQAIRDGYEGGILRLDESGYEAGFRSRNLLKIKKFDDSEHTIVDVVEGKDRNVNDTNLKVACFICETPDGKQFECLAFGDMYEKDQIWHNREQYVGKILTVKHSGYTAEGKPFHAVALRLREDI